MKSDLFASEHLAQQHAAPGMSLQNAKAVKYVVNGEMHARQGAMIAYRGNLQFERKGQGVGGVWWLTRPSGAKIMTGVGSGGGSGTGSGGGSGYGTGGGY